MDSFFCSPRPPAPFFDFSESWGHPVKTEGYCRPIRAIARLAAGLVRSLFWFSRSSGRIFYFDASTATRQDIFGLSPVSDRRNEAPAAKLGDHLAGRGWQMARYFFHLESRTDILQDDTGEEISDIEEAVSHAAQVARELARNRLERVRARERLLVTDAAGVVLFRLPLLSCHVEPGFHGLGGGSRSRAGGTL